jgi:hypothetical protein
VYRLGQGAPGNVTLIVSNAAGDTLARLNGAGGAGVHRVNWNFQYTPRREAVELSPSQRRDSILLRVRAPMVLDSLQKAGFDTAAIRQVRAQVNVMTNPAAALGAAAAGRGGRGGGGGRGGNAGGQECHHPLTQWDQFCARPAEAAGGRGGAGGGGGFGVDSATAALFTAPAAGVSGAGQGGRGGRGGRATNEDVPPTTRIWNIIGMSPPNGGGGRGGGGGGGAFAAFAGAGPQTAMSGDYLVTMTVNGQTYKQTFRVERANGGGGADNPFGGDEEHDQSGRYTPKVPQGK